MKTNIKPSHAVTNHGGSPAFPHLTLIERLRRSVLSCLLWEDEFYEDGVPIALRIAELARQVSTEELAALAVEARSDFRLRHAPLWLLVALSQRQGRIVGDTIYRTIQRADEIAEFLNLYWTPKRHPLSKQVKLGVARAFRKFDEYQLAKYNRDGRVKLRDALFMVHAKPESAVQAELWQRLAEGRLATPDTWEANLSGGADKKATFERLLQERRLGYMALLRNLRGMMEAGVSRSLIADAILARRGAHNVLPFRYVAAARACPQFDAELDEALKFAISEMPVMPGFTVVLVDVSGSMNYPVSARSQLTRMDAAAALASLIHAGGLRVFSFSDYFQEVAPRRGLAGVDAVVSSQRHSGTRLANAVTQANGIPGVDRLIVVTDEQATDGSVPDPVAPHAYMINVASYQHGVNHGRWTRLNGFSESVLRYITEVEAETAA